MSKKNKSQQFLYSLIEGEFQMTEEIKQEVGQNFIQDKSNKEDQVGTILKSFQPYYENDQDDSNPPENEFPQQDQNNQIQIGQLKTNYSNKINSDYSQNLSNYLAQNIYIQQKSQIYSEDQNSQNQIREFQEDEQQSNSNSQQDKSGNNENALQQINLENNQINDKNNFYNSKNVITGFFIELIPFIIWFLNNNIKPVPLYEEQPFLKELHLLICNNINSKSGKKQQKSKDINDLKLFFSEFKGFDKYDIKLIIENKERNQGIKSKIRVKEERTEKEIEFEHAIRLLFTIEDEEILKEFSLNLINNFQQLEYQHAINVLNLLLKKPLILKNFNEKIKNFDLINKNSRIITQYYLERKFKFDVVESKKIKDKFSYLLFGCDLAQRLSNPNSIKSLK